MHGTLVFIGVGCAHREFAAGNPDHPLGRGARGRVRIQLGRRIVGNFTEGAVPVLGHGPGEIGHAGQEPQKAEDSKKKEKVVLLAARHVLFQGPADG